MVEVEIIFILKLERKALISERNSLLFLQNLPDSKEFQPEGFEGFEDLEPAYQVFCSSFLH